MVPLARLNKCHNQEWKQSGVDTSLTALNVVSVDGQPALEFFAEASKITDQAGFFRRYCHIKQGGWWSSGRDPLNNWQDMPWGQFKPDNPRPNLDKPGKFIKYENPLGCPTRAIFLRVSWKVGLTIAKQWNYELSYQARLQSAFASTHINLEEFRKTEDSGFWQWALEQDIPIVILEGAKKAGCVLTAGFLAVALPGVWNGIRKNNSGIRQLIPELEAIARPGKRFIIAFDEDEKLKTRENAHLAILLTGQLLQQKGCQVSRTSWDWHLGKGIDDVFATHGVDKVHEILGNTVEPENPRGFGEPDRLADDFPIEIQQQCEADETAQEAERIKRRFSQLFERKHKGKTHRRRQRVQPLQSIQNFKQVILKQGESIHDLYEDAIEQQGYHHILDARGTGAGKSYSAGNLNPDRFTQQQDKEGKARPASLWYLTSQSRNPSTETIEANYTELPIRSHGMTTVVGLRTPLNNPVKRPIFDSEHPGGKGNCDRSHLFNIAGEKNVGANGQQEASNNPICQSCQYNQPVKGSKSPKCATERGAGYGYRFERREAMLSRCLRLHPASAPAQIPPNTTAFWEEVNVLIAPVPRKMSLTDLNAQWSAVRDFNLDLANKLYPIEKALRTAIEEQTRYGISHADFEIGVVLETSQKHEILNQLRPILEKPLDKLGVENLTKCPVQGLLDVITILFFPMGGHGGFTVNNGSISISLPNERVKQLVQEFRANIYLDATIDPQVLCDKLGIEPNQLLIIVDNRQTSSNLKHYQIDGFGCCRRDRASSTNERLKRLDEGIRANAVIKLGTHSFETATADYKDLAKEFEAEIRHLSNSRGSNEIQGKQVFIVHGLPRPNLGAAREEYSTLKSPKYSFEQFYQHKCDSEIYQLIGRLRTNLYPNRNFLIYWVTEEILPFETEQLEAVDLNWEAAPTGQKTTRSIFESILQCVQAGLGLTQKFIAQLAGCTQSYISQWFSARGGWSFWKGIFKNKQPEDLEEYRNQLSDEEKAIVELLPLLIEEASDDTEAVLNTVDQALQGFGGDSFARIWQGVNQNARNRFATALLALEPLCICPQGGAVS
ncbi:DUF3854 domain-containing protein [Leptolyngbya boryana CZ1]|uniref:DUF3854 domain-containing protein n=1 Tax=Leptolyngbya boryana CZ1 TaxID=3060204 RepID=A0AA97ANU8_LEPBY|nr:DUF3854 domain-containing protein [Leptolyngbya boryana]WNZ46133.1 DUF3854 domain-containing protein [Leptolyngbya boryana CZ1]